MSDIVPLGTKLKSGTVSGVHFSNGERYYFICGELGCVDLMPSDVVDREYKELTK